MTSAAPPAAAGGGGGRERRHRGPTSRRTGGARTAARLCACKKKKKKPEEEREARTEGLRGACAAAPLNTRVTAGRHLPPGARNRRCGGAGLALRRPDPREEAQGRGGTRPRLPPVPLRRYRRREAGNVNLVLYGFKRNRGVRGAGAARTCAARPPPVTRREAARGGGGRRRDPARRRLPGRVAGGG